MMIRTEALMNTEEKEGKPKRSKVMRFILIAIALAYFWASRYEIAFDQGKMIQYNKWTGNINVRIVKANP